MKSFLTVFFLSTSVMAFAQSGSPPLYDTDDAGIPSDIAIGESKKKARQKPEAPVAEAPAAETPASRAPAAEVPVAEAPVTTPPAAEEPLPPPPTPEPEEKMKEVQSIPAAPIALPAQPEAKAEPMPPPKEEKEMVETLEVPKPVTPPAKIPPAAEAPAAAPAAPEGTSLEIPPDGGPGKDAGSDPATALPVTYAQYRENYFTEKDMTDVFKFYARSNEAIGMILIPAHPAMQLLVEILGENGELLSQTQAASPGASLSFQTSPLDKNRVIYIQVRDVSLIVRGNSAPELRKYTLELKPIAALPPGAVAKSAESPAPTENPPAPAAVASREPEMKAPKKPAAQEPASEKAGFFEDPIVLYGLGIAGVLALSLVVLIVRKRKAGKSKTPPQPPAEGEQHVE